MRLPVTGAPLWSAPMSTTSLACRCGQVQLAIEGAPILSAECCCNSCRAGGDRIASLPGAPQFRTPCSTPYVLVRKDRVRFVRGAEHLRQFKLKPDAPTRRVVAACCNTPLFTEFQAGHWLSLYASLWPEAARPRMEMRNNAGDLPDPAVLPHDIPNHKVVGASFIVKLLLAFAAMGFRAPKIATAGELRFSNAGNS